MVSYCNSLAMYRHQQQGHAAPGWYQSYQPHQVPQQYLSCDEQGLPPWHHPPHPPHAVFQPDWSPSASSEYMHHHQHGLHQHGLQDPLRDPLSTDPILPSPPMTVSGSDMSSPSGGGTASPPQTGGRPLPARSPYEWMKKPSYQSQPNPGECATLTNGERIHIVSMSKRRGF